MPHRAKPPRALEGREKGTQGLVGNIAGEHSDASRAPAGALAVWGGSFPVVSPPANLLQASGSWTIKLPVRIEGSRAIQPIVLP